MLFSEGLTLGLGQEMYLTSLEYPIVPENKEVLKQTKQPTTTTTKHNEEGMSKVQWEPTERVPNGPNWKKFEQEYKEA